MSPLPGSRCIHSQPRSPCQRTYRPASSRPLSVRSLSPLAHRNVNVHQRVQILRIIRASNQVNELLQVGVLRSRTGITQTREVRNREAHRIKQGNLLIRHAARLLTGQNLPELHHREVRVLLLNLALNAGLRRELNKHGGAVQNFAFQLSLAGAVATNSVQVHAGLYLAVQQNLRLLLIGGAGGDDVCTLDSLVHVLSQVDAEAQRLKVTAELLHRVRINVVDGQVLNAEHRAHTQRLEKTQQAITQLTESIAEIRADLQLLTEGTQSAAVDREALDQKTEELQNALRAARDQADGLRDQVTQQRLQFAEMEHSIETLRRDKARWAEESAALQGTLNALREKIAAQRQQAQEAEGQLAQLRQAAQQQAEAARQADADTDQLEQKRQAQLAHQRELVEESERLYERHTQDGDQLHRTEILYDRADNEQETLSEHMWNTYEATLATAEEFRLPPGEFALTSGERDANGLRREIRELGPINAHAVEEYAQTKERFDDLSRQKEDMTKAESDLRGLIKRLLSQMEKQFVTEFDRLNGYFQQPFVRLFGGGQAELKLTDPNDPLCCGIEVVAQPPGKKLQLLSLLSGGERSLASLALLIAIYMSRPSPFYALDEVEAALDDRNLSRLLQVLGELGERSQLIVVTHQKRTMQMAQTLYGVSMREGVSAVLSQDMEELRELL